MGGGGGFGDHLTTTQINLAHMIVHGRFLFKFQSAVSPFFLIFKHYGDHCITTMVVFRDRLAHIVVNGRFLFKFQSAVRPF